MRIRTLVWSVLLVTSLGPARGELGRGQPALASDTGPTGTEASPAGSLTAPHTGQVSSHDRPACSPSGSTEAPTDPRTSSFSPASPESWRELAGSLRNLAEALRQLPDQLETRLQLLQRASQAAYTAGRWRGWIEGGLATAGLVLVLIFVQRRQSSRPTA